jgi:hypothetical protein
MKYLYILLFRLAISFIIVSIISFFFFKGIQLFKTSLLALIMIVLAYLFEYTRKRDSG